MSAKYQSKGLEPFCFGASYFVWTDAGFFRTRDVVTQTHAGPVAFKLRSS